MSIFAYKVGDRVRILPGEFPEIDTPDFKVGQEGTITKIVDSDIVMYPYVTDMSPIYSFSETELELVMPTPTPIAAADIQVGDKVKRVQVKHLVGNGMEETITSELVFIVEEVQNRSGTFTFLPTGDEMKVTSVGTGLKVTWFLLERPEKSLAVGDEITDDDWHRVPKGSWLRGEGPLKHQPIDYKRWEGQLLSHAWKWTIAELPKT
jgi:hypothetical protein